MHLNKRLKLVAANDISPMIDRQAPRTGNYVGVTIFRRKTPEIFRAPLQNCVVSSYACCQIFEGSTCPQLNSAGAYGVELYNDIIQSLEGLLANGHVERQRPAEYRYNFQIV